MEYNYLKDIEKWEEKNGRKIYLSDLSYPAWFNKLARKKD